MLPNTIQFQPHEEQRQRSKITLSDWDASSRFQGDPPPRKWLAEGAILSGKAALVAAAGGVGKSYALLDFGRKVAAFKSLTNNQKFTPFGRLVRGGVVVMLCAEDDSTEIHNRLISLGELPPLGRLMVIPLPDAGGVEPLFQLDPNSRAPMTSIAFDLLEIQLKQIRELALIVFDPLQALCGGLDLNLPQHGQHVCSQLSRLAAETGAAVVVTHHLRKGGEIKTPEEARDAIRGSGGLVDGVRSAIVLWPENSDESKTACNRLGVTWERSRVCKLAVVKANFPADLKIKTLVRNESGLLEDRGFDLHQVSPGRDQVESKFIDEIETAAKAGNPFTRTGINGVFERRHELSNFFHSHSKKQLVGMAQDFLNEGKLSLFKDPSKPRFGATFLGKPNGVLFDLTITVPTIVAEMVKSGNGET